MRAVQRYQPTDGIFIIAADYNHANLNFVLRQLCQHVKFATSGENTLDLFYAHVPATFVRLLTLTVKTVWCLYSMLYYAALRSMMKHTLYVRHMCGNDREPELEPCVFEYFTCRL